MAKYKHCWRKKLRGIMMTRLLARDGDNCSICGGPMDRRIRASIPDGRDTPDMITFDHVVPRSSGGTSDADNLRLAHGRCNWARGNDPLVEEL